MASFAQLSIFVLAIGAAIGQPAAWAATISASPLQAEPGGTVQLSGTAKPGSSMSFTVSVDGKARQVGVAQVDGKGHYSLSIRVPPDVSAGPLTIMGGCDACGNGWSRSQVTVVQAQTSPSRGRSRTQSLPTYSSSTATQRQPVDSPATGRTQSLPTYSSSAGTQQQAASPPVAGRTQSLPTYTTGTTSSAAAQQSAARAPPAEQVQALPPPAASAVAQQDPRAAGARYHIQPLMPPSGTAGGCVPAQVKTILPQPAERCFGAIGSACDDQVAKRRIPLKGNDSNRAIVNPDCTITIAVSVGSILHDNCCKRNGNGLHCRGAEPGDMAVDFVDDSKVCAREWRKASYDVLEGRYWFEKFGPYANDATADPLVYTNGRHSKLPGRFGVQDHPVDFQWGETEGTRKLKAPSGIRLEIYDVEFCSSGHFSSTGWCSAGAICSNQNELDAANQKVRDWETWRMKKENEAKRYWNVDPKAVAIRLEIASAEPDHAARVANLTRLQGIFNTRNSHWGICQ